jgi:hypothetical protein
MMGTPHETGDLFVVNSRAKSGSGSALFDYAPLAALLLASFVVWFLLRNASMLDQSIAHRLLLLIAALGVFGALLLLALRASWVVKIRPNRVVLRKSLLACFFFVAWPALLPVSFYLYQSIHDYRLLAAHSGVASMLLLVFMLVGAAGLPFIVKASPVSLICDPERKTYKYANGIPPFRRVSRGELYDMLGIRVDDEKNRYLVHVSWRARRWKIEIGRYGSRDRANDLGRRIAKAIGTSYWPAD